MIYLKKQKQKWAKKKKKKVQIRNYQILFAIYHF